MDPPRDSLFKQASVHGSTWMIRRETGSMIPFLTFRAFSLVSSSIPSAGSSVKAKVIVIDFAYDPLVKRVSFPEGFSLKIAGISRSRVNEPLPSPEEVPRLYPPSDQEAKALLPPSIFFFSMFYLLFYLRPSSHLAVFLSLSFLQDGWHSGFFSRLPPSPGYSSILLVS